MSGTYSSRSPELRMDVNMKDIIYEYGGGIRNGKKLKSYSRRLVFTGHDCRLRDVLL
jgi:NADH:ubiquinone oxidoreductase subunit F (NADH-binding)